jgi:hypothetical protein
MTRHPDWQVRLQALVTEWNDASFIYGKYDCALFGAAAVQAMTGVDLARGLRGYRTEAGGLKKVQAKGYADHVDVFAQALESTPRPRWGDLAIVQSGADRAIGVMGARVVYVMRPDRGLATAFRSWCKGGFVV